MEAPASFERAARYTLDSIEHCQQLANFIKKRLAIEEEYAKALRTPLAASLPTRAPREAVQISLPHAPPAAPTAAAKGLLVLPIKARRDRPRRGRWQNVSHRHRPGRPTARSLWSTFYEIVDDTAQVSKSHVSAPSRHPLPVQRVRSQSPCSTSSSSPSAPRSRRWRAVGGGWWRRACSWAGISSTQRWPCARFP